MLTSISTASIIFLSHLVQLNKQMVCITYMHEFRTVPPIVLQGYLISLDMNYTNFAIAPCGH